MSSIVGETRAAAPGTYRWLQLLVGIACMAMIANLQYGWTLFVNPIDVKYHWGRAAIQVAFSVFVLLETWLVPVKGYLVDRFGPRLVVLCGGILCGIAWAMNAYADTLAMLYAAAAIGGVGAWATRSSGSRTVATGSWHAVFVVAALMNALAALMAWFVLRPMRRSFVEKAG